MLVLDGEAVRALYPMAESIASMRNALRAFSSGTVVQPQRAMLRTAGGSVFAVMPAYLEPGPQPDADTGFGIKIIAIKPDNPGRGLPSHVGLVLVLDEETGRPAAMMDGAQITAIRTAAVSAVATDLLAREDASTLALLGAGVQARTHLEAMAQVRPVTRVTVWSRDPQRARAFAERARDLPFPVEPAATPAQAAAGADIICTVSGSAEPLLDAHDVSEGAHINAVGSSFPDRRELSGSLVARCSVFVDSRHAAQAEAGDLLLAAAEGLLPADAVRAEIGELLLGTATGRLKPGETTLFKSLGLAVEDTAAGLAVARRARERGLGIDVPFLGGEHGPDA